MGSHLVMVSKPSERFFQCSCGACFCSASALTTHIRDTPMADQTDAAPATDKADSRKMDAGKIPMWQGLINYFPRALVAVALVSEYGKRKYDPENPIFDTGWARVTNGIPRYKDAEMRHFIKETIGSDYDEESEMAHRAHKLWNDMAVLERDLRDGRVELRRGVEIVNGKPQPGTSKKVEL